MAAMEGFSCRPAGQEPARCLLVASSPGPPSKKIAVKEQTDVLEIILNLGLSLPSPAGYQLMLTPRIGFLNVLLTRRLLGSLG